MSAPAPAAPPTPRTKPQLELVDEPSSTTNAVPIPLVKASTEEEHTNVVGAADVEYGDGDGDDLTDVVDARVIERAPLPPPSSPIPLSKLSGDDDTATNVMPMPGLSRVEEDEEEDVTTIADATGEKVHALLPRPASVPGRAPLPPLRAPSIPPPARAPQFSSSRSVPPPPAPVPGAPRGRSVPPPAPPGSQRASAPPPLRASSVPPPSRRHSAPPPRASVPPPPPLAAAAHSLDPDTGRAHWEPAQAIPQSRRPQYVEPEARVVGPAGSLAPAHVSIVPRPRRRDLIWIAAGSVAAAAAIAFFVQPGAGTVRVDVTSTGSAPIEGLQVFVDGVQRCTSAPCDVADLSEGTHFVSVAANGFESTAGQALSIRAGETTTHSMQLGKATGTTGLTLSSDMQGLRASVDGRDLGVLPTSVSAMEPGEHFVKVFDHEGRFVPYEERVNLTNGDTRRIEGIKLKVARGQVTVTAGTDADGAVVQLDGKRLANLPVTLDLDATRDHTLSATKRGFATFSRSLDFQDGDPTLKVAIDLAAEQGASEPVSTPRRSWRRGPVSNTTTPRRTVAPQASGSGTLNINSIPMSKVILNGRLLGSTPLIGIKASGPQSVVFIHPEMGRKTASTVVGAGERKTIAVRF